MQLNHHNSNFQKKTFPITIVCDNVNNAPNIGSLFRIADAFGVEELIFCGKDIPLGKRIKRTSRSTEKYVKYRVEENIVSVLLEYNTEKYTRIALEITKSSNNLDDFKLSNNQSIILVVGNENTGVSNAALQFCSEHIHINMYGENSSMNVVQATSISLYELTKQLLQ